MEKSKKCMCPSHPQDTFKCMADDDHSCVCIYSVIKCRGDSHGCTCAKSTDDCRAETHECHCRELCMVCLAENHLM